MGPAETAVAVSVKAKTRSRTRDSDGGTIVSSVYVLIGISRLGLPTSRSIRPVASIVTKLFAAHRRKATSETGDALYVSLADLFSADRAGHKQTPRSLRRGTLGSTRDPPGKPAQAAFFPTRCFRPVFFTAAAARLTAHRRNADFFAISTHIQSECGGPAVRQQKQAGVSLCPDDALRRRAGSEFSQFRSSSQGAVSEGPRPSFLRKTTRQSPPLAAEHAVQGASVRCRLFKVVPAPYEQDFSRPERDRQPAGNDDEKYPPVHNPRLSEMRQIIGPTPTPWYCMYHAARLPWAKLPAFAC